MLPMLGCVDRHLAPPPPIRTIRQTLLCFTKPGTLTVVWTEGASAGAEDQTCRFAPGVIGGRSCLPSRTAICRNIWGEASGAPGVVGRWPNPVHRSAIYLWTDD